MWQKLKKLFGPAGRRRLARELGTTTVPWNRVVMNRATQELVASLPCAELDVLEISGTDWRDSRCHFSSYKSICFPEYDICDRPVGVAVCDLLIAEQVFEHIRNPHRAARNVFTMLREGGAVLITTPFLLKIHPFPEDLYRWTEDGIRLLLEEAGFTEVVTGSWGNRKCLIADMTRDMKWTLYHPMLHSLKNEPQFPVSVWAFGRKPRSERVDSGQPGQNLQLAAQDEATPQF